MKKVINHKLYNTDTAELLGQYSFVNGYSDVNYLYEALYIGLKEEPTLFMEKVVPEQSMPLWLVQILGQEEKT